MNIGLYTQFSHIVFVLFIWVVLTLWVFINTKGYLMLKIAVIPLVFVVSILSLSMIDSLLGRAKHVADVPQQFIFLGYNVILNDDRVKTSIEMWIKDHDDTKLLSVPYSKKLEKLFEEALKRKASKKGSQIEMERNKKGSLADDDDDRESSSSPFVIRDKTPPEPMKNML